MGETLAVLKETWKRFWPNPYIWLWPTGGWIGSFVLSMVFLILLLLGPVGVLLMLFGLLAYGSLIFSGLIGACAAAAGTERGRADWPDVAGATKRFFWPTMALMALALGGCVLLSVLATVGLMPLVSGATLAMEQAATIEALGRALGAMLAWTWVAVAALSFVAALLFGFAPAAMGIERLSALPGIGRGLAFVGQRFGLAAGVIGAGVVLVVVVPCLLTWPLVGGMVDAMLSMAASGALDSAAPTANDLGALLGMAGYMTGAMALSLVVTLYSLLALPFAMLATFIAYHRHLLTVSVPTRPVHRSM